MFAVIIVLFGVVAWGFMEYVYEPRESVDLTDELDDEDTEDAEEESDEEDEEQSFDPESVENVRTVSAGFASDEIIYTKVTERHSSKLLEPYMSAIKAADAKEKYPRNINEDYIFNFVDIFEFGVVASGDYAGYKLLTVMVACDGPCWAQDDFKFLYNEEEEEFIYLSSMSSSDPANINFLSPLFANSTSVKFDGFDAPTTINAPSGMKLVEAGRGQVMPENLSEYYKVIFTDKNFGSLYGSDSSGCLYLLTPDNVVVRYDMDLGFMGEGADVLRMPNGTYANLNNDYQLEAGGCGISGSCFNIYQVDESNLKSVGRSNSGQEFFVPIKYDEAGQHYTYKYDITGPAGLYDMHIRYGSGSSSFSYSDFMNEYPVLFWKDAFGRWSTLVRNEYAPVAECGKPVVYLYPEQKMTVAVKVLLDELTVTVPEHGEEGWNVEASPNGKLVNLEDGETYDYLFWEGHKEPVLEANKGFMVEKDEVKKFLKSSLKEMDFNRAERKDFMEFWYPVMMSYEHPKFFVSFVGTEDFNKVAPLEITPAPDTLYRMFMYFEPTYEDREVVPQELSGFDREGFTVVEWGGTSSIPWK